MLREIAHAIQGAARDTDAAFRYGGDEFAVLLPHSDARGLHPVAERIRASVEAVGAAGSPWAREGVSVSASIGTASYPIDGDTPEAVLLAADRACFVAKRRGRGPGGDGVGGTRPGGRVHAVRAHPGGPADRQRVGWSRRPRNKHGPSGVHDPGCTRGPSGDHDPGRTRGPAPSPTARSTACLRRPGQPPAPVARPPSRSCASPSRSSLGPACRPRSGRPPHPWSRPPRSRPCRRPRPRPGPPTPTPGPRVRAAQGRPRRHADLARPQVQDQRAARSRTGIATSIRRSIPSRRATRPDNLKRGWVLQDPAGRGVLAPARRRRDGRGGHAGARGGLRDRGAVGRRGGEPGGVVRRRRCGGGKPGPSAVPAGGRTCRRPAVRAVPAGGPYVPSRPAGRTCRISHSTAAGRLSMP